MKMKNDAIALMIMVFGLMSCTAYNAQYPLHSAAYKGNAPQVQAMIKSGAPIEGRDSAGITPLMAAASYGHWGTVRVLVEMGADINFQDSTGMTPLLYAVASCHPDIVTLLVDRGARTDVRAENGWTAIHFVVNDCSESPEKALAIINILLEKGCDISAVDSQGHTAYWTIMNMPYISTLTDMIAILRRKGVTERFQGGYASGFDEALRSPSFFTPPSGAYFIPEGQENNYQLAVEDCNHIVVPYRTGLLMTTGPFGYGIAALFDKNSVPAKHQVCMEKMGFRRIKQ